MDVDDMMGRTLVSVEGLERGSETATFTADDGTKWQMHYEQDCCASCRVEDVCGDVADLIGSPIVRAEDPSSMDGFENERAADYGSHTWTFYILGTAKGTLTVRWYGSSNGYYSEAPSFYRLGVDGHRVW